MRIIEEPKKPLQDARDELHKKVHSEDNMTSDEWYLNEIEKYKDTEFYQQLLNNPYLRRNNAEYNSGWLEDIGSFFGFGKGEENYYENLLSARNEYFNEILGQMREQAHNDPAAEVARRKAAGLNDDLSGGQAIGTGEAAQNDQPKGQAPKMMGAENVMQGVNAIWNSFQSAYGMVMGMLQDSQKLKETQNSIESGEIDNAGKYAELAKKLFGFGISTVADKEGHPTIGSSPADYFEPLFKNKKRFKKFQSAYELAEMSVDGLKEIAKSGKEFKQESIENAEMEGRFRAAGFAPLAKVGGDIAREFAQDVSKMEMEMKKNLAKAEKKHAENYLAYETKKDYGQVATLENLTTGAAIRKANMQKTFNNFLNQWTKKLEIMSNEDGIKGAFASVMLGYMALQQANMIPQLSLPSFNFSNKNGKKSFGIGF